MAQSWLTKSSPWRNRLAIAYFGALFFWSVFHAFDFGQRATQDIYAPSADGNSDYVQFYMIDKILCSSEKGKIYDHDVQAKWERRLVGPYFKQHIVIENSPVIFLFTMPFVIFPMKISHLLWSSVTLLYASGMMYLISKSHDGSKFLPLMIIVGTIASAASHMEIEFGQVTYLILGSIAGYFWGLLNSKNAPAGFFLTLCAGKYQLIPLLALACIPNKQFKPLFYMSAFISLLVVVLGFWWGWSNYIDYPGSLLGGDSTSVHKAMPCLRGLLCCLGMSSKASLIVDLVVLFLAFILLLFKAWKMSLNALGCRLWFAILITLTLLLTPHCFTNYSVLHGVTAALFLPEFFALKFEENKRARILAWLLVLSPILSWLSFALLSLRIPETFAYVGFNIAVAFLLFGLLQEQIAPEVSRTDMPRI